MKYLGFAVLLTILLLSCGKERLPAFKAFDFSYNDVFHTCFSIKFTNGDTVFIRQHFIKSDTDILKNNTTYYSLLNQHERDYIDSFITSFNFSKLNDRYYEDYQDGNEYQFFIEKGSLKKKIYVHSDGVPTMLHLFANKIVDIKSRLKLIPIDTTIEFGSLKYFLPPGIPHPLIKFTPPKIMEKNP